MNKKMRQGASLSGHERNCTFLNTRGKGFATVSSVSGFDFDDDARGLATVDWDGDGDLDVWVSNRTSPRLRFLQNGLPDRTASLGLLLKGKTCNRDAIGARAELFVTGGDKPRIATVRAGEGYLSQSSKWLHFGLADGSPVDHRPGDRGLAATAPLPIDIERIEIHWPDGTRQTVRGVEAGKRYRIVQGTEVELVESRSQTSIVLEPQERGGQQEHEEGQRTEKDEYASSFETGTARVALTSPIPSPTLPYRPFVDTTGHTTDHPDEKAKVKVPPPVRDAIGTGVPTLINLWASWCHPCVQELNEFTHERDRIAAAQLRIVAIAVDGQIGGNDASAVELARRMDVPFPSGSATDELIRRLTTIHDASFSVEVPMPVPTSFLMDENDRVCAIYRGPVTVTQLLSDVKAMQAGHEAWQRAALPLKGIWNEPPKPTNRLAVGRDLLSRKQTRDARDYINKFSSYLASDGEFTKLGAWLADELIADGDTSEGIREYEKALRRAPNDVTLLNNLAWQRATQSDENVRNGMRAIELAEKAARITRHQNAGVLDTLAASYAAAGNFDKAVATISKAIEQTPSHEVERLKKLEARRRTYANRVALRL